ncbi:hypothetical protein ALC62_05376, partial [Cyphomyrmex costatus]
TSELKTIDSFFYMSTKGHLTSPVRERKKNNQSSTSQPCNCTKPDEQDSQDAAFYKRLIAIIISNLMMQKVNEKYTGILNIEVSSLDFEYMQKFVDGQGSIREIDRILKNTIKRSETSICNYMIEASHCFNSFLDKTLMLYIYCKSWIIDHWDVIIIAFTVLFSFIILWRKRWSRSLFIFLTIDVIFIISFFITWWRLIEEAEIKLTAAQAQFAEMPITCQPHKMGLWDKAIAWLFSTNDCEKYYETIMANPKLQVTPAFALTYFLSMTIFQPLSCFGLIISEFIDNATGKLNFICKFPITIALFLSICVGIILIPLSWIGGSINFGLGPFFKFGLKGRQSYNDQEERIERIREVLTTFLYIYEILAIFLYIFFYVLIINFSC